MMPVDAPRTTSAQPMTEDVETLLNPAEADGTFHDSAECLGALLGGGSGSGGGILSPPTPRPKKG